MKTKTKTIKSIAALTAVSASVSSGALIWEHTDGSIANISIVSGETIVPYTDATPDDTLLSYGTLENTGSGGTVGYTVQLNEVGNQNNSNNSTATNRSLVIDTSGNLQFFSDIRSTSSFIEYQVNFYDLSNSFSSPGTTDFSSEIATTVPISITSPFSQPSTFAPAGADVLRLRDVEILDISAINPTGTLTSSVSDPFNQVQSGLTPATGFDTAFGWEAAGFLNDLDADSRLDVNEALFTFDLSAAEGFILRRDNDAGSRSAFALTAAGLSPNGVVPEPSSALLIALSSAFVVIRRRRV